MRFLYARPDHERRRSYRGRLCRIRPRAHPGRHERQSLPLRRLYRHCQRCDRGAIAHGVAKRHRRSGMNSFEYVRPSTIGEALTASAQHNSAFLAGGTNLLDLMKGGVSRPARLIDISRLPGLDQIEITADGAVRIGELVRNSDLAHHPEIGSRFPMVAEALLAGASAQLRNAATTAGNVMQRTRCAYFYDPASACNKRIPGSGCDARGGDNRHHAILGWSTSCIATHPSDFCVALVALDAVVEIEGRAGRREIPLEMLHCLPGDRPDRESVLGPGE